MKKTLNRLFATVGAVLLAEAGVSGLDLDSARHREGELTKRIKL